MSLTFKLNTRLYFILICYFLFILADSESDNGDEDDVKADQRQLENPSDETDSSDGDDEEDDEETQVPREHRPAQPAVLSVPPPSSLPPPVIKLPSGPPPPPVGLPPTMMFRPPPMRPMGMGIRMPPGEMGAGKSI